MLLEKISSPEDLRKLNIDELNTLADEIRRYIIQVVSRTGGHLAPSLGAVELTLALHYVFDTPKDVIVWDVGHQAYAHKIITGRKNDFKKLRQFGGISGFLSRDESEYDVFGAGHSSTSISAALGIREALDKKGEKDTKVIAVIGDGALTAGVAFEALNNAGAKEDKDIIVILNDNGMSISPNVGAIASFLSRKMTGKLMTSLRNDVKNFLKKLGVPGAIDLVRRIEDSMKSIISPSSLFESFGFTYLGPINGHKIEELIEVFRNAKIQKRPLLIHVLTKKGKGYAPAEMNPEKFHGVGPFDVSSGEFSKSKKPPSYTSIFSNTLIKLAKSDEDIVAITAAMPSGTGLNKFKEVFPDRFYDVGIAEQHAVLLAAGMAIKGLKPVVAIYSTFLQRAFDQLIHDIALQNLSVIFALDRAGIVGEDGPTHHGIFDLSYLRLIPGFTVAVPKDENELKDLLYSAFQWGSGPKAIRYPRGAGVGVEVTEAFNLIPEGQWEILKEGHSGVIFATGYGVYPSLRVADKLAAEGINLAVVNARFIKPLDDKILKNYLHLPVVFVVEENNIVGGLGGAISEYYCDDKGPIVFRIGIKDMFPPVGSQSDVRKFVGLDEEGIYLQIKNLYSRTSLS